MDISEKTIAILNNFAGINESILFRPGRDISTISSGKNIYATARVGEQFDREIAIFDLNKLLAVVKLYENPVFEFNETFMVIRNGVNSNQYTRYYYSSPNVVVAPPAKGIVFPDNPTVSFELTQSDMQTLVRGCNIMGLKEVEIVGVENEPISIRGFSSGNQSAGDFNHSFNLTANSNFSFQIQVENLSKLMAGDYEIAISDHKISRFINKKTNVVYYISISLSGV